MHGNRLRLLSENEASRTDRIAAHIIERAPAPFRLQPDIVQILGIVVGECATNQTQFAQFSTRYNFPDSMPARMMSVHKSLGKNDAMLLGDSRHFCSFLARKR
ncbi:hypothetical protein D3C77_530750 [compost metagenome]